MVFFWKKFQECLDSLKTIQNIHSFIGTAIVVGGATTGRQEIASYVHTYTHHKPAATNPSYRETYILTSVPQVYLKAFTETL